MIMKLIRIMLQEQNWEIWLYLIYIARNWNAPARLDSAQKLCSSARLSSENFSSNSSLVVKNSQNCNHMLSGGPPVVGQIMLIVYERKTNSYIPLLICSAMDNVINHVNENILKKRGYDPMPTYLYNFYQKVMKT